MNLDAFTSEQLAQMIANIAAELARRSIAPAPQPIDPMQAMLAGLAQPASTQYAGQPPHPHGLPERTEPIAEPRGRKAFAGGANGRDGSPPDSLAAAPVISRPVATNGFGPGVVRATSRTDPALAKAFGILPERGDEDPPMQGTGQGVGKIDLEPVR